MYKILSTCKGGGYLYCRTNPVHPKANSKGLYPLHRVLAEIKVGRPLKTNEDVHHQDGNKFNNEMANLIVLPKSDHAKIHRQVMPLKTTTCCYCGKDFEVKGYSYRLRTKRNYLNAIFCSRKCATKNQYRNKPG